MQLRLRGVITHCNMAGKSLILHMAGVMMIRRVMFIKAIRTQFLISLTLITFCITLKFILVRILFFLLKQVSSNAKVVQLVVAQFTLGGYCSLRILLTVERQSLCGRFMELLVWKIYELPMYRLPVQWIYETFPHDLTDTWHLPQMRRQISILTACSKISPHSLPWNLS